MNSGIAITAGRGGPKRRQRHYLYDESTDEAAALIADEPVEIEEEQPAEPNEPIERIDESAPEAPVFEQ